MSQHDQDLQQEQQLLEHFREHSRGEPSAAVDALILAAAHNALVDAQPRLNWSQRLHAWLFGAGSRTRWSMAVAGLAVFGIGLNLSLHTREQLPQAYDAPAPASAPALQEMAPAMEERKQSAEREYKKAEQPEQSVAGALDSGASFSVSPAATAAPRPMAPAKPLAAPSVEAMADSAAAPAEADAARKEARAKAAAKEFAKAKAASEAGAEDLAQERLSDSLSEDQLAETLGHSDVPEAPSLELQLHNVLHMRQAGQHADADRLLAMLKREFPQRDLDAELKHLQAELEKPDSSR